MGLYSPRSSYVPRTLGAQLPVQPVTASEVAVQTPSVPPLVPGGQLVLQGVQLWAPRAAVNVFEPQGVQTVRPADGLYVPA